MREDFYGTQTGVYSRIPGPRNLARHPAPKSNHTASTLAPQPMTDRHLKVPAKHLDKPLFPKLAFKVNSVPVIASSPITKQISTKMQLAIT